MKKTLIRSLTATVLMGAMSLSAVPAFAQVPDVTGDLPIDVPGVGDIGSLEDLLDLPGLDLADPILGPVSGVIDTLSGLVDEVLGLTPLPNVLALQGEDAVDAAIAFSQATYEESDTAVLARDDLFADALTTGALQGVYDAPLLLTESADLDRRTATELVRLGVENLVIVGGEDAINPLVIQKLDIAGINVTRVGGPTRIETAANAAEATAPDATTAVLTRAYSATADDSQAYADLLAVSPWAAENNWPVLLTETQALTASARDHIAASDISDIVIIGGTGAVSQVVEDELASMGVTVRRVAGASRFGTAVAIAEERGYSDSADADRLILAEGASTRDDVWAPGFAAAAHASRNGAPILLTNGAAIPAETLAFITAGMADNLLDGGPATLCASFVDPIACEAAGLLLIGNITDALDILGLGLVDLPDPSFLLNSLGLGDLADLLDSLDGVVDGVINGIAAGDLEAVVAALTSGAAGLDEIQGLVDGLLGSLPGTDIVDGGLDGLIDEILGRVGGVPGLPGLPGTGDGDGGVGGVLDPIIGGGLLPPVIPGLPGLGG